MAGRDCFPARHGKMIQPAAVRRSHVDEPTLHVSLINVCALMRAAGHKQRRQAQNSGTHSRPICSHHLLLSLPLSRAARRRMQPMHQESGNVPPQRLAVRRAAMKCLGIKAGGGRVQHHQSDGGKNDHHRIDLRRDGAPALPGALPPRSPIAPCRTVVAAAPGSAAGRHRSVPRASRWRESTACARCL